MVIQIVLIAAVLIFFIYYLRSRGSSRSSALFKLLFLAFCLFGIYTVIRPNDLTELAQAVGVDRGTDLMLYALVVTFGFTTVGTYLRFREQELRYTRLVRAIALQGAEIRIQEAAIEPAVRASANVGEETPSGQDSPEDTAEGRDAPGDQQAGEGEDASTLDASNGSTRTR
ncbi:DUF2304 domain-containing protein [Tomitella fengzijianii]|uniref:DUF2304 domain-containing protein n=1 Tax=Tomitella fengzijianii TaxID=2597660 RepID=A0A516X058_9ACTN|nr:DUF2304 domain-containing protein [Tomitella fengzijianii]QDQ96476.1 DUF2304 domain-containing protein [Tomitella fengzijianii]